MMTPERAIRLALVRALTWKQEIIATELGAVSFHDHGAPPLRATLGGVEYDIAIVVARRREHST